MGKMKDIAIEAEEQGRDPEDYWLEKSLRYKEEWRKRMMDSFDKKKEHKYPDVDDEAPF